MRLRDSNEFIADIIVTRWLERQNQNFYYLLRKDYIHRTAKYTKQNDSLFFHWERDTTQRKGKTQRVNYDRYVLSNCVKIRDMILLLLRRLISLGT